MFRKKITFLGSVAALAFCLSSTDVLAEREFHNADKTQSFKGKVIGYNAEKKKVTIRTSRGGVTHATLSSFSKEDQLYILDISNVMVATKSLEISFKEVKGAGSPKTGFATGYDFRLYNRDKTEIKDIEVKYTIYYRQGSAKKGVKSVAKTLGGNLKVANLAGSLKETLTSEKVRLVREVVKGKAGGG